MNWITRERPKIDRIACPWLIKRFIDPEAIFHFTKPEEVIEKGRRLDAIPFDVPGVEYTHYDDQCTFDYFLKKHELKDPGLATLAKMVRAADTDQHHVCIESAGLWAVSAGLAFNIKDDHELLEAGFVVYDALLSWARHLQGQLHTQNPSERLLVEIYRKFLHEKTSREKIPEWVMELKEMIQDQVDTDFNLSLEEISDSLQLNPAYLSRKFSKYFDNLTFGEYMRKLRIEKAVGLLETTDYSLAEIALITGFSDQSHFTRIFKKHMGTPPNAYRRKLK